MIEDLHATLRARALGTSYQKQAATELLIRLHGGRYVRYGQPLLMFDEYGEPWIDFSANRVEPGGLPYGERQLLSLVASLANGGVEIELGRVMDALDHVTLPLVLAAINHAAGGNNGSRIEYVEVAGTGAGAWLAAPEESLFPWPELPAERTAR